VRVFCLIFSVPPQRSPATAGQGEPVGTEGTRRVKSGHSLGPFLPPDALTTAFTRAPPLTRGAHTTQRPLGTHFALPTPFALHARMSRSANIAAISLLTLESDPCQPHVSFDTLGSRWPRWAWRSDYDGGADGRCGVGRSERSSCAAAGGSIFSGSSWQSHRPRRTRFTLGSNFTFWTVFSAITFDTWRSLQSHHAHRSWGSRRSRRAAEFAVTVAISAASFPSTAVARFTRHARSADSAGGAGKSRLSFGAGVT